MPRVREDLAVSIRLLLLFVLLSGIPLAVLGWLGWRWLDQDRLLETQRLRERLDNAAILVSHELDRRLADWESLLAKASEGSVPELPPGTAYLLTDTHGVVRHHGLPIPFYPQVSLPPEAPEDVFASIEAHEFREGNYAKAAGAYRALAKSSNPGIQAGALLRLGRCLQKLDRTQEALVVYGRLLNLADVLVAGAPSELVARRERIKLFTDIHSEESRQREGKLLYAALADARFVIDRPTFEFYSEAVRSSPVLAPGSDLAEAIEGLWPEWQQQPTGRTTFVTDQAAVVAVWRSSPSGKAILVSNVGTLVAPIAGIVRNLQVQLALNDPAGRPVWGYVGGNVQAIRDIRETRLPWTIHAAPMDLVTAQVQWRVRRNWLLAGFGLMALVITIASYAVFRAVTRELRVARLQSDFVDTVSHEFRSPLTAMRHLTEMLEEGHVSATRSMDYYRALGRETRRLQEMVENLLNFGRINSGFETYLLEETSPIKLAERVVDEFRDRALDTAHRIELSAAPVGQKNLRIQADQKAISIALRNLLDNAIKYSPESTIVRVGVECRHDLAGISVQDEGPGIPKEEQRAVFQKFVRGAAARDLNVKGTGIGLTMAAQIVQAHGGRLELSSEPGHGARFTILLPFLDER